MKASDVSPESSLTRLSFYYNNERTLLADQSSTGVGKTGTDTGRRGGRCSSRVERPTSPPSSERDQFPEEFEDSINEVYGPPMKRPRYSILEPEVHSSES